MNEIKGYDLFLMAAILQLMVAVLWNPEPRGESYWVRLKHLTSRGIYRNVYKFMNRYISMKAAIEARRRHPKPKTILPSEPFSSVLEPAYVTIAKLRKREYNNLYYEYSVRYRPTLSKIRWILAMISYIVIILETCSN